ncbi:MAG: hypothetical protein WC812_03645 [Candidatus Pacearchaeota archaeon]|jgi:hypothetical protein
MSEITIEQVIKIILGVFLVVAVVLGVYFIFKDKFIEFFKGLPTGGNASLQNILYLLK